MLFFQRNLSLVISAPTKNGYKKPGWTEVQPGFFNSSACASGCGATLVPPSRLVVVSTCLLATPSAGKLQARKAGIFVARSCQPRQSSSGATCL